VFGFRPKGLSFSPRVIFQDGKDLNKTANTTLQISMLRVAAIVLPLLGFGQAAQ
jgi:hypothetical protein